MNAPTLTIMSKDNDGYELSIFPDGRITYKGTPDEAARNFLDALCNVIDEEKCASRVANERSYKTIKTIIDEVQGLNKEEILTKLDELAVEAHRRWTWEILKDTK
jgi:hypothetical protein